MKHFVSYILCYQFDASVHIHPSCLQLCVKKLINYSIKYIKGLANRQTKSEGGLSDINI